MSEQDPLTERDDLVAETRKFWRGIGQEMVKNAITEANDTAEQYITVLGILIGLYIGAIALSDLGTQQIIWWKLVIYMLPLVLMLSSMIAACLVYFPPNLGARYTINIHSSEGCKRVFQKVLDQKLRRLAASSIFLILGVLFMAGAVAVFLLA